MHVIEKKQYFFVSISGAMSKMKKTILFYIFSEAARTESYYDTVAVFFLSFYFVLRWVIA